METMTNRELEAALVLQHLQVQLTPSATRTRHWGAKKRRSSAPSANLARTPQARSPVGRESSPATSGEAVLKPNSAAEGSPVSPFLFDQCEKGGRAAHSGGSRRIHLPDGRHDNSNQTAQLAKLGRLANLEVVDPTAYSGDLGDLSPRFWSLGSGGGGRGGSRVVDPTACFGYELGIVGHWEDEKKVAAADARRRRVEIKRRKAAAAAVVLLRQGRRGNSAAGATRLRCDPHLS